MKTLTPAGQFYCKSCNQYKNLAERSSRYGVCDMCWMKQIKGKAS